MRFVPSFDECEKRLPLDGSTDIITPMSPTLLGWSDWTNLADAATGVIGTVADTAVTTFFDATTNGWYTALGGTPTPVTDPAE